MKQNNLTNSNKFRDFLIGNASNIISNNIKTLESNYRCNYNTPVNQMVMSADASGYISGPLSNPNDNKAPA
jgi:hypothetical protein